MLSLSPKAKINKGFTCKYNCDKLVYFEEFQLVVDAIAREKQIKNWKREWKKDMENKENAEWKDLSETIGVTKEWIGSVKDHYLGWGQARNDVPRGVVCIIGNTLNKMLYVSLEIADQVRDDAESQARNDELGQNCKFFKAYCG